MTELVGPLVLVGCGKMGSALLRGWLAHGLAARRRLRGRAGCRDAARARGHSIGVVAVAEAEGLPADLRPRALVFAIKPQSMAAVLPAYRALARSGAVVLSIAAGTAIARFDRRRSARAPRSCGRCRTPRRRSAEGVAALYANATSAPARSSCAKR